MGQRSSSRREFLADASRWVAGVALGARTIYTLPATRAARRLAPAVWLPDPTAPDTLRALALAAIDAARQAGASFADVRVGEKRRFGARAPTDVTWRVGYGVRALVNGAWGAAYGAILSQDAIVASAREAVAAARGAAAVNLAIGAPPVELAPAPAVTGEWTSPVVVPPLSVPTDEQVRVVDAWKRTMAPVYGFGVEGGLEWEVATRVMASSDGTLVTQHLTRAVPRLNVGFNARWHTGVDTDVPGVIPQTAGFELVMARDIPDRIRQAAEALLPLAVLPGKTFEQMGKYPIVIDGMGMSRLLGFTLGQALDGDRVVGFEADAAGRSFLAPTAPESLSVGPAFSPLVRVTADRALPGYTAVQWDDEGVVPAATTLIEGGHVLGLLTTRETASLVRAGSASRGSGGYASAPQASEALMAGGAHLALAPSSAPVPLEDLLRGVTHGLLILGGEPVLEPGLSTGLYNGHIVLEVRNGKPVAHVHNVKPRFRTRRLWMDQLHALGDAGTVVTTVVRTPKGMPWQDMTSVATAPAALFTDVDVVRADA